MKFKEYLTEGKLRGTSPTEDGIKKIISDYFYGSTITLEKIDDKKYAIYNKKGKLDRYQVIKKGGRFRFEEIS